MGGGESKWIEGKVKTACCDTHGYKLALPVRITFDCIRLLADFIKNQHCPLFIGGGEAVWRKERKNMVSNVISQNGRRVTDMNCPLLFRSRYWRLSRWQYELTFRGLGAETDILCLGRQAINPSEDFAGREGAGAPRSLTHLQISWYKAGSSSCASIMPWERTLTK